MYIIWLYFEVRCSLKSFSCNVDVRPSITRNAPISAKPFRLLPLATFELVGPVMRNSVLPKVTAAATAQSRKP